MQAIDSLTVLTLPLQPSPSPIPDATLVWLAEGCDMLYPFFLGCTWKNWQKMWYNRLELLKQQVELYYIG